MGQWLEGLEGEAELRWEPVVISSELRHPLGPVYLDPSGSPPSTFESRL